MSQPYWHGGDTLLAQRRFPFDVALSFAGEDRGYAKKLEELLRSEGLRVYFDGEQQPDLWGKGLKRRLADVYTSESRYCIILVSANYMKKRWTRYEWEVLQRRLSQDRPKRHDDPAVLPVRLDDTEWIICRMTVHTWMPGWSDYGELPSA